MLFGVNRFKRMNAAGRKPSAATIKRGPSEFAVLKDYSSVPEVIGERQLRFTISTAAVDRALDVVDQAGWDLSGYRRNPVVLWQHNSWDLPIGKCVDIGLQSGALCATVEFVRADMPSGLGELAETILQMCKEGFLSATSVGFRPLEFDVTEDPSRGADDWLPGFDFKRQDLTEFSIVTVPCNPDAVIDPAHREGAADPMAAIRDVVSDAPATALRAKALRRLQFDRRFPA